MTRIFAIKTLVNDTRTTRPYLQIPCSGLKTVSQWKTEVDWDHWETNPWVVVDPVSGSTLLYLSEADYLLLSRTVMNNGKTLVVVATPSSSRPTVPPGNGTSGSPSHLDSETYADYIRRLVVQLRSSRGDARSSRDAKISRTQGLSALPRVNGRLTSELRKIQRNFLLSCIRSGVRIDGSKVTKKSIKFESMVYLQEGNFLPILGSWLKTLAFWNGYRLNSKGYVMLLWLWNLTRARGLRYLVTYLKVSLVVLNKYIGGERLQSTEALGCRVRLAHGLPSFLPGNFRQAIRSRVVPTIRFIASFLNSYKGMKSGWKYPSYATLNLTIGATMKVPDGHRMVDIKFFAGKYFSGWILQRLGWNNFRLPTFRPLEHLFLNFSSGPTSSTVAGLNTRISSLGMFRDIVFLYVMYPTTLVKYLRATGSRVQPSTPGEHPKSLKSFWKCPWDERLSLALSPFKTFVNMAFNLGLLNQENWAGRLALKFEPAGKVRVFAIVDNFTQCLLRPFHNLLFEVLRRIEEDATFDQDGSLETFVREFKGPYYSFDLKSATDLIPQYLYRQVLGAMWTDDFADAWIGLLTNRDYYIPWLDADGYQAEDGRGRPISTSNEVSEVGTRSTSQSNFIRYTTGQPMGALSSWAALALVHHFLVQYAHYLSCQSLGRAYTWFAGYRVLGDDIVLTDKPTADAYLQLCSEFGIEVGLAKSYTSQDLLNFANQTYYKGVNISPASIREEISVASASARREMVNRLLRRWFGSSVLEAPALALRLAGTPRFWRALQGALKQGELPALERAVLRYLLNPFSKSSRSELKSAQSQISYLRTLCPGAGVLSWITGVSQVFCVAENLEFLQSISLPFGNDQTEGRIVTHLGNLAWGVFRRVEFAHLELINRGFGWVALEGVFTSSDTLREGPKNPSTRGSWNHLLIPGRRLLEVAFRDILDIRGEIASLVRSLNHPGPTLFERFAMMERILYLYSSLPSVPNYNAVEWVPDRERSEHVTDTFWETVMAPLELSVGLDSSDLLSYLDFDAVDETVLDTQIRALTEDLTTRLGAHVSLWNHFHGQWIYSDVGTWGRTPPLFIAEDWIYLPYEDDLTVAQPISTDVRCGHFPWDLIVPVEDWPHDHRFELRPKAKRTLSDLWDSAGTELYSGDWQATR